MAADYMRLVEETDLREQKDRDMVLDPEDILLDRMAEIGAIPDHCMELVGHVGNLH